MPYYPPSGTSYPYSAYHPPPQNAANYSAATSHAQTPGAYPTSAYQTPYPTSVQGYGAWPYAAYSYYQPQQQQQQQTAQQQQQQQGQQAKPQQAAKAPVKASTPAPTTPVPPSAPAPVATTSQTTAPLQTQMYTPAQYAAATGAPTTSTMSTMTSTMAPRPYTSTYTYMPSYHNTLAAASSGGARGTSGKKTAFRGLFAKELRNLMYGFGDDRNPANDTVNVMEEILVEYIVDVCQTALAPGKKSRLSIEDLRRALSRPADAKKLARMEELLFMQEDIKRARAQFEESDMNQASYQS